MVKRRFFEFLGAVSLKLPYYSWSVGLILVLSMANLSFIQAGDQDSIKDHKHQIGFKRGLNSGNSAIYRFWPGKFGIEGTASPRFNQSYTEVKIGIAGIYELIEGAIFDYYGTVGNDVFYTESNSEYLPPYSRTSQGVTWDIKAGIGVEVEIVNQVILNGVIGAVSERVVREDFEAGFNAELSVLYAF